jgi:hypothetical protein
MSHPTRAFASGPVSIASVALAAFGLLLTGCAGGPDGRPRPISVGETPDGLGKVSTRGPGALFVKPNHPVGSYDDIMVATIGIHYAPGQDELTEEQEDVIFDRMVGTLYEGVAASFGLAKQPGPCTVKMGLYLKDVDFYESRTSGSQTRFVNSYGAATLVFEFRDSMTDEPLVRYGQRRSFGSGVDAGNARGPELDRLGDTLDKMLEDVGLTLQEVHAPNVAADAARGCSGNLGRSLAES